LAFFNFSFHPPRSPVVGPTQNECQSKGPAQALSNRKAENCGEVGEADLPVNFPPPQVPISLSTHLDSEFFEVRA